MKILIISLPRTGSTSFLANLSEKYDLEPISEPFNPVNGNLKKFEGYDWLNKDNIVVKTHINHQNRLFYLDFVKLFDEVFLLSRKDLKACSESLAYANYYNNFSDSYVWNETPNLQENVVLINKFNEDLIFLSKSINKDITYYEDIFDVTSKEKLRVNNIKIKTII